MHLEGKMAIEMMFHHRFGSQRRAVSYYKYGT